jgi:rubrerythrin
MGKGKDAKVLGGVGRGMDNKKPRSVKHQHDRIVDKRRRRIGKKECAVGIMGMYGTAHKQINDGEDAQICPNCGNPIELINCVCSCPKCDWWQHSSS